MDPGLRNLKVIYDRGDGFYEDISIAPKNPSI
jgi:hypothetical protein